MGAGLVCGASPLARGAFSFGRAGGGSGCDLAVEASMDLSVGRVLVESGASTEMRGSVLVLGVWGRSYNFCLGEISIRATRIWMGFDRV